MRGQLIVFVEGRGFGFLEPVDGGADVFVHVSEFHKAGLGEPVVGQWFNFETELGQGGKVRACDLRKLDQKVAEVEAAYAARE